MQKEGKNVLVGHLSKSLVLVATTLLVYLLLCEVTGTEKQKQGGTCCGAQMPDALCCVFFCVAFYGMSEIVFQLFSPYLRYKKVFLLFLGTEMLLAIGLALCLQTVELYFVSQHADVTGLLGRISFCLIAAVAALIVILQKMYKTLTQHIAHNDDLELHLLKKQLDPHFLFNSLGFVRGQIDENPTAAKQSLCDLSLAYRYILSHSMGEKVYISEDIRFIRIYTGFITMRYPGHFNFKIDPNLDEDLDYILPYVVQMLVENAVKHNKHSVETPLTIEIKDDFGYVVVSNSYNPVAIIEESYKVGLENIRRRYKLIFHRHVHVSQENEKFTVKIPIIKNESISS